MLAVKIILFLMFAGFGYSVGGRQKLKFGSAP